MRHEIEMTTGKETSGVPCHLCGKLLAETYIRKHVATVHHDIRNHACNICEKREPTGAKLEEHIMLKHLNEEPQHGCPVCPIRQKTTPIL